MHTSMFLLLIGVATLFAAPTQGAFTYEDLLGGAESPGEATFESFKSLLGQSIYPASNDFVAANVTGSFLAFTDTAFENFAAGHGFKNATAFMDWLGSKDKATCEQVATEMIDLHILPTLDSNTTNTAGIRFAQTRGDAGLVKLMFGGDGNVTAFVYPTFKYMPKDASDFEETENEHNGTYAESQSRRNLLFDHGVRSLTFVNGGEPAGSKQCYYLNETALAPVSLVNMMASRQSSAYDAISVVPSLSLFKSILDMDLEGMRALRDELAATDFNGTLFAPHDDAVATFLDDLKVDLPRLRDEFPSVLVSMVQYHILPYNLTIADLTMPGMEDEDDEERGDRVGEEGGDRDEREGEDRGGGEGQDMDAGEGMDRDDEEGQDREEGEGMDREGREGKDRDEEEGMDSGEEEGMDRTRRPQALRALLYDHKEEGKENNDGHANDASHVRNRFHTRRPGSVDDLDVIKAGNGMVMIRGRMGEADFMTPDSQISINGRAYIHVIDSVLRVKNVATSKKAAAHEDAANSDFHVPAHLDMYMQALANITSVDDFFKAHTLHLEPDATYGNGTVFATDLEGTNIQYIEDAEGNGSFSFIRAAATHDWDDSSCGGSSGRKSRRSMLSLRTQRRSLLQSSAGFAGSVSLGDGQVIFSEGAMATSDDATTPTEDVRTPTDDATTPPNDAKTPPTDAATDLPGDSSARKAAPSLVILAMLPAFTLSLLTYSNV
ncbi:hypothetical protein DUNSADRAFT_2775 [Dunaliella salina]|uniref:FAS1 domain-containing protein n=1 Tax=Dunaliella salina TaxID=3046 RepID=A0ABQ7GV84_DUNSA|nr:hypothetical protein DUNSADRAFT_2775 [Dunaliella salina]|eukprot:KAF5838505.1 hypothetical protein DUNSADRAFT_2775 [Dunaliella salina]